ncbi:MAG: AsmA-like C-terminal domain-containing protein [Roseibium sp.]
MGCILILSGIVALFARGPVTVPLLGNLLSQQGSRGPVSLEIGSASLDFTDPSGIKIVVYHAEIVIEGEAPVTILLPRVEAPLDRSALLSGNVQFSSLHLIKPIVTVAISGGPAAIPDIGPLMEAVDRMSDLVDDQFARRAVSAVSVQDATFEITGPAPRSFKRIEVDISRRKNRIIEANAKVTGGVSTWDLKLVRSAPEGAGQKKIGVVVNGITLAELLGPDARKITGKGLRLPASAKVETVLTEAGEFVSSNVVARVGNGWFQLGRTLVAFDDVAVSLLFKRNQEQIEITPSHIIRGNTRIFFTGSVTPPETADQNWDLVLDSKHPLFGSSDVAEQPIRLDGIAVRGTFDADERILNIDRFTARSGKAVVHGVAKFQITQNGPYLAIAADGEKIPAAVAKQVWPITLVPPARKWFIDRITDGLIEDFSYTAAIQPPGFNFRDPFAGWNGNDMTMDMSFSGGAVLPIGDVPETRGLSGTVTIKDETLTVEASGGRTAVEGDGVVSIPQTTFQIFDLPWREGKTARVLARLEGKNADLGSIMNSAPFRVADRAGLKQGGVTGAGWIDIEAGFPMAKSIDFAAVNWQASGGSNDFSDANPIMGHTIRDADIVFEADKTQVAIIGNGVLDDLKADINLVVPLGKSEIVARQDVVVDVTAQQLKDRGIDLTAFLNGGMKLSVAKVEGGQEFSIDLRETEVSLKALGWKKAKGVPAIASFKLVEVENQRRVNDFALTADGVDLFGQMRLSLDGELIESSFERFQLRPDDDVVVDIQRADNGRYDIIFTGTSFDGRGLISSLRSPGGSQGEGDFAKGARISVTLDRVTGFNDKWVRGFSGKIDTGPKGLLSADIQGLVDGSSDFKFTLVQQDQVQLANGQFEDTGASLSFLDLYQRMKGGKGTLEIVLADEDSWVGEFNVRTLAITEDPAIRKIRARNRRENLDSNDPIRIQESVDGSASFDTLDISFTRDSDIMTISRGALRGTSLGGTVSGTIDLAQQTLNMTGTFVPIYALNNFFSKIPLLGFALGGGTGEGLIGVTYRLSGAVSDPVLTVNPISAIAPGIFRKMFEFQPN